MNNNQPWMSVVYWEKNDRLGDKFMGCSPEITIDSGYNPDTDNGKRLCLGPFCNANRDERTKNIRCHIGSGVKITGGHATSMVTLENLSEHAVFVQSQNWNERMSKSSQAIIKLPSKGRADIFCNIDFSKRLQASVNKGYENVAALGNMCTIRLREVLNVNFDQVLLIICTHCYQNNANIFKIFYKFCQRMGRRIQNYPYNKLAMLD